MVNVRKSTILLMLLTAVAAFLLTSCGEVSGGELRFVERQPGDVSQNESNQPVVPNTTRSSKVEISESSQKILKVCVLPFFNRSDDSRLDATTFLIQLGIEGKLEEFNRMFEPVTIELDDYQKLASELGRGSRAEPDETIASAVRDMYGADIIIFGKIEVVDDEIVIEPYIFSYEGKYAPQSLGPRKVDMTRPWALVDLFVDELINDIIEYLQI